MATASSESSSRTPSATVSAGSSSRISSRTVASTSVSAEKSKSCPLRLHKRGRKTRKVGRHRLHQRRAQIRIERLDQVTDVSLVKVADQLAQRRGIAGRNR